MSKNPKETIKEAQKRIGELIASSYQSKETFAQTELVSVEERIKRAKAKGLEQDIELKKNTLKILFIFLFSETIVVFIFSFLQATTCLNFMLEEWSFKLLVSATLLQITYMVRAAVQHLFPTKASR